MKNAFCTFIYGNYYRYIPYYILSINKNYPSTSILVYYQEKLPEKYKAFIKNHKNVFLEENFGNDQLWLNELGHRGARKQTLRHLLKKENFQKFDNVYFGDVDIIILKEKGNLFDFHLNQCERINLPFSNRVRPQAEEKNKPSGRLTGLHFVKVEDYFKKMDLVIDNFFHNKNFKDSILKDTTRNEHVLYNLCMEAFRFDPYQLMQLERPWHGFHLGLVRGKKYLNYKTIDENSSLTIDMLKRQLKAFNEDNTIDELLVRFFCKEVYHTYSFLGLPLSKRVHIKYKLYFFRKRASNMLKKIKASFFN